MKVLHRREYLDTGDIVEVDCSRQCNVMLLDDTNFRYCKNGDKFSYRGGLYKKLPARIGAPNPGYWNIVIDLGAGTATIRPSIRIIKQG